MPKLSPYWLALIPLVSLLAMFLDPTRVVLGKLAGEPFFNQRPMSYWAKELSGGPASQAAALVQLKQPAAVPMLRALLTEAVHPRASEIRLAAVELLGQLGPDAHAAGPDLLTLLNDPDPLLPPVVASTLPKLGVPAAETVTALVPLLQGPSAAVVARAISTYRHAAAEALPALERLAIDESRDSESRWNAVRTIGKVGPAAVVTVPTLVALLNHPDSTLREHAAEAIGDVGPSAAFALPELLPLLQDSDTRVRLFTVRAIGDLGEAASPHAPDLVPLLQDEQSTVREMTRKVLKKLAPELIPAPAASTPESQDDRPPPPALPLPIPTAV